VQRLHIVSESAIATRRSEQRAETAAQLIAVARRYTAERGFSGFTLEELCAEVGVSRRTFFNYFASKEDAVLGTAEHDEMRRLTDRFTALGSRGWPAVIDDLVELAAEHAQAAGFSPRAHADFFRAVEREPRLLTRFIGLTREREEVLIELVAAREGVSTDDLRVRAAVQVFSTVLRSAGDRIHDPRASVDFATAVHDSLAAIRAVTATPAAHKADQKDNE